MKLLKKLPIIATLLITCFVLMSCTDDNWAWIGTHYIKDNSEYWQTIHLENNSKVTLHPKYVDGKSDIDSVSYYWNDDHLMTVRQMPFTYEFTIHAENHEEYELHSVVYYHDFTTIDYISVYRIDDGSYNSQKGTYINNQSSKIYVDNHSNVIVLVVETNVSWNLTEVPVWVTASPNFGDGNTIVKLLVSENLTDNEREADILFKTENNSEILAISQAAGNPKPSYTIGVSSDKIEFNSLGGSQYLTILGDATWKITPSEEWCNIDSNKGTGEKQIEITVGKNTSSEFREAHLFISSNAGDIDVLIHQSGGIIPGGGDNPNPTY